MKKHSFLFYFFLWPFLLVFYFYKYLFKALHYIFQFLYSCILHIIDYCSIHHPFHKAMYYFKNTILYCYKCSVVASRIVYASVLALYIAFVGVLFNTRESISQYIITFLLSLCVLAIAIVIASLIFRAIYRLITYFHGKSESSSKPSSSTTEISRSEEPSHEIHGSEEPSSQTHGSEEPSSQTHGSEEPSSQIHGSEEPSSQTHGSEEPSSQIHGSEEPSSQIPDSKEDNISNSNINSIENKNNIISDSSLLKNIHINLANAPASDERMRLPLSASYTVSFEEFCKYIVQEGDATVNMLQVNFGLTFFEASDLFSKLEAYGIVGHDCPPYHRNVLVSQSELLQFFSDNIISDDDKKITYKTTSPIVYDVIETDNGFKTVIKKYGQHNETPYWKQIRNGARMEFEMNNLDLTNVTLFFNNGILCRVMPDVQSYYSARYYVIDGSFFDTYSLSDVEAIPIPSFNESYGTPVYNLEYLLKMRASQERDKKNYDLSYALMYKSIDGMKASKLNYGKKEYMRFIMWLYKDDRINEAVTLENRLRREIPEVFDINLYHKNYFISKLNECKAFNTDYIYCDGHIGACSECAKYQNRVYCLSGNDLSFPKLPDFVYEYGGFHPGCRHSFSPYLGGSITDRRGNIVDTLSYSNRPFEDDRTSEEITINTEFNEKHRKEQAHENDLKAFYVLRHQLPDTMPASYQTFKRYKSKNTPEYAAIVAVANERGISSSLLN